MEKSQSLDEKLIMVKNENFAHSELEVAKKESGITSPVGITEYVTLGKIDGLVRTINIYYEQKNLRDIFFSVDTEEYLDTELSTINDVIQAFNKIKVSAKNSNNEVNLLNIYLREMIDIDNETHKVILTVKTILLLDVEILVVIDKRYEELVIDDVFAAINTGLKNMAFVFKLACQNDGFGNTIKLFK